jgi:hypothetical protein
LDEGDAAGAVGIVFDADHGGGGVEFAALEIDEAVVALVAATDVAAGDAAGVVAAAAALERVSRLFSGLLLVISSKDGRFL